MSHYALVNRLDGARDRDSASPHYPPVPLKSRLTLSHYNLMTFPITR